MSKNEILEKMKTARSWNELGKSIHDVYKVFSSDSSVGYDGTDNSTLEKMEDEYMALKTSYEECQESIKEMQSKINRLTETNKQLRSENKALKNGDKKV